MKDYSKERDLFLLKNYPVTRVIVPILKFIGWSLVIISLVGAFILYLDNPDSTWLEFLSFFPLALGMVAVAEILVIQVDKNYFLYKQTEDKL